MTNSPMPKQSEDELETLINDFITKWCGDNAAHLLDNDENDGERLRQSVHRYAQKIVMEELRQLNQSAVGENCCSTHHDLANRIAAIEKEIEG